MIFINCTAFPSLKYFQIEENIIPTIFLRKFISNELKTDAFLLYHNGIKLEGDDYMPNGSTVQVAFGLLGGKGGFGSMLRAIGAQIEKTTNREACRDLSGRRLRDINEEQRLKRWISKEAEREADKIKRRKERIERLKSQPKHSFVDFEYEKERSELPDRIDEALIQGLQKKSSSAKKRNMCSEPGSSSKKSRGWLKMEESYSSSESESTETESGEPSTSKYEKGDTREQNDFSSNSESNESSDTAHSNTDRESTGNNNEIKNDQEEQNQHTHMTDSDVSLSTDSTEHKLIDSDDIQSTDKDKIVRSDTSGTTTNSEAENTNGSEDVSKSSVPPPVEQEQTCQDDSPINLMLFASAADLEVLGLEKLKVALMDKGLKCGGTLTDRAQRLWKIKNLEPHEYPANLLAKKVKK